MNQKPYVEVGATNQLSYCL